MAKYMQVAADANNVAKEVLAHVPTDAQPLVAEMIARLVNLGVRCSPRGVHHTVRLNAVTRAVQGLPVKVSMVSKKSPSGYTYNALTTCPIGILADAHIEGDSED